jgi:hypothetical protein
MNTKQNILNVLIILGLLVFCNLKLVAQECPFGIENCKGQCGRFIDTDGDGYCDYTIITEPIDTIILSEDTHEEINSQQNQQNSENTGTIISSDTNHAMTENSDHHDIQFISQAKLSANENNKDNKKHGYRFILWTLLTFGAYFLSIILYRTRIYNKRTHRRIWNGLLLITFLVSGILGLVLVIQINYQIFFEYFFTFLQWHVDFGIGMAWIAIFHVIWHFKYFRNIFKSGFKHTPEC